MAQAGTTPSGGTSSAEIWGMTQWPSGRAAWCDLSYDTPESFRRDWSSFLRDPINLEHTDRYLRWYFSVGNVNEIPDWAAEMVAEIALETA